MGETDFRIAPPKQGVFQLRERMFRDSKAEGSKLRMS